MNSLQTCKVPDCGRPALPGNDLCSQCDAEFSDYLRRREQKPTYPPVNLAHIDRTTPGQHNLKIDLAKELKPITEVIADHIEQTFHAIDPVQLPFDEQMIEIGAFKQPKTDGFLAKLYPKYYKSTQGMTEIDVYAVHYLFDIQDPSGAIQHASKKLLLSGVRTGGKSKFQDIKEARDTLNRWLELNKE